MKYITLIVALLVSANATAEDIDYSALTLQEVYALEFPEADHVWMSESEWKAEEGQTLLKELVEKHDFDFIRAVTVGFTIIEIGNHLLTREEYVGPDGKLYTIAFYKIGTVTYPVRRYKTKTPDVYACEHSYRAIVILPECAIVQPRANKKPWEMEWKALGDSAFIEAE